MFNNVSSSLHTLIIVCTQTFLSPQCVVLYFSWPVDSSWVRWWKGPVGWESCPVHCGTGTGHFLKTQVTFLFATCLNVEEWVEYRNFFGKYKPSVIGYFLVRVMRAGVFCCSAKLGAPHLMNLMCIWVSNSPQVLTAIVVETSGAFSEQKRDTKKNGPKNQHDSPFVVAIDAVLEAFQLRKTAWYICQTHYDHMIW